MKWPAPGLLLINLEFQVTRPALAPPQNPNKPIDRVFFSSNLEKKGSLHVAEVLPVDATCVMSASGIIHGLLVRWMQHSSPRKRVAGALRAA
jgi:hypothetical protein